MRSTKWIYVPNICYKSSQVGSWVAKELDPHGIRGCDDIWRWLISTVVSNQGRKWTMSISDFDIIPTCDGSSIGITFYVELIERHSEYFCRVFTRYHPLTIQFRFIVAIMVSVIAFNLDTGWTRDLKWTSATLRTTIGESSNGYKSEEKRVLKCDGDAIDHSKRTLRHWCCDPSWIAMSWCWN